MQIHLTNFTLILICVILGLTILGVLIWLAIHVERNSRRLKHLLALFEDDQPK